MGATGCAFFSCWMLTPDIRDVQDHTVAVLLFLLLRVCLEAIEVPGPDLDRQGGMGHQQQQQMGRCAPPT